MNLTSVLAFALIIVVCAEKTIGFREYQSFPDKNQELGELSKSKRCFFYALQFKCYSETGFKVFNKNVERTETMNTDLRKGTVPIPILSPFQYFTINGDDGTRMQKNYGTNRMWNDKLDFAPPGIETRSSFSEEQPNIFEPQQRGVPDIFSFVPLHKKTMEGNKNDGSDDEQEVLPTFQISSSVAQHPNYKPQKADHPVIVLLLLSQHDSNSEQEDVHHPESVTEVLHPETTVENNATNKPVEEDEESAVAGNEYPSGSEQNEDDYEIHLPYVPDPEYSDDEHKHPISWDSYEDDF